MRYKEPYMNFIMTPPQQEEAKYRMYEPKVSTMRVLSKRESSGLGEVSEVVPSMGCSGGQNNWLMPVVVIVVSAMALMTLYAVITYKR